MYPIAAFVIPIAVALAVGLLFKSASPHATRSGSRTIVQYGWGFKGFAVFSGILTLAPLVGMFFVAPQDRVWLLLIALVFGIPATYLVLEGFFVRVVFSERGIEAHSPWRKNRVVSWQEVSCVSYSPGARWHRIETQEQGFIRLHEMKSGVSTLLGELRQRGVGGA